MTNGHILENMESCSTYYFNMVELQGKVMGTPIPTPLIVTTGFNANSPPKFVNVNFRPNDPHQLILSWAAPCPVPDKNLDYQVSRTYNSDIFQLLYSRTYDELCNNCHTLN